AIEPGGAAANALFDLVGLDEQIEREDLLAEVPLVEIGPEDDLVEPLQLGQRERSEEHTSELQSLTNLVCRLLLEKKKSTIGQDMRPYRDRGPVRSHTQAICRRRRRNRDRRSQRNVYAEVEHSAGRQNRYHVSTSS